MLLESVEQTVLGRVQKGRFVAVLQFASTLWCHRHWDRDPRPPCRHRHRVHRRQVVAKPMTLVPVVVTDPSGGTLGKEAFMIGRTLETVATATQTAAIQNTYVVRDEEEGQAPERPLGACDRYSAFVIFSVCSCSL